MSNTYCTTKGYMEHDTLMDEESALLGIFSYFDANSFQQNFLLRRMEKEN